MTNRQVTSREYKLMLNTDRFRNRGRGTEIFFALLLFLIDKEGGEIVTKEKDKPVEIQGEEERRLTSYLDTPELALRQADYSLRLRDERAVGGKLQVNLKYRSSDRYLSAAQNLSSNAEKDDPKFEEDILPPFVSKFSNSNSVKFKEDPDLDTVGKLTKLFLGLADLKLDQDIPVRKINNFTALEIVRKLCIFRFGEGLEIKASLSFWYLEEGEEGWPLVGELSFDYDEPKLEDDADKNKPKGKDADKLEQYPTKTVEGANRLFVALQGQAGWFNPNGTTKTAFALEVL